MFFSRFLLCTELLLALALVLKTGHCIRGKNQYSIHMSKCCFQNEIKVSEHLEYSCQKSQEQSFAALSYQLCLLTLAKFSLG